MPSVFSVLKLAACIVMLMTISPHTPFIRLGPLFVLHFVEGLPQNDISKYAFDFQGMHYSVSVIIQYAEHRKHFVTWLRASSG